jgi:predicted lysophospholipase L1 biosynthesis ABC-type transport system permease subunit
MDELESGLQDISAIRAMMDRASKFLSLSGLSGISAGVIALAGSWAALRAMQESGAHIPLPGEAETGDAWLGRFLVADAISVLVLALACSIYFSVRMSRKKGYPLWGPTTVYLLAALMIPLAAGGAFCGVLLYHGIYSLLPAVMLLFYGLALLNAGNFTFSEVRYLGIIDILLGLTAGFHPAIGLILWAGGFGLLHIVYGILLYAKYEK